MEKIDSHALLQESCVMSSYFESTISDCGDHRRNEERAQGLPWAPPIRSKKGPIRSKMWEKRTKMDLFGVSSFMKIPLVIQV